jgi:hypothetical protein
MSMFKFYVVTWSAMWLFQVGCVIAGTLEWWVLFAIPLAFALGIGAAEISIRVRSRRIRRSR